MPAGFYHLDQRSGEMLYGLSVIGPGFELNAKGKGSASGWTWYDTEAAAYAAEGVTARYEASDQQLVREALAKVKSADLVTKVEAVLSGARTPSGAAIPSKA